MYITNIAADTLPRMTPAPSASTEPQSGKWVRRPDTLVKDEETVKTAPRAAIENVELEFTKESDEPKEKYAMRRMSDEKRPKLKEIARQSSKEVIRYTEVEQRQTVLEQEPVVSQASSEAKAMAKPLQKVTAVLDEHGISRKGSDEISHSIITSHPTHHCTT